MRKSILRIIVPVACFLATQTMAHTLVDSVKINHATDGNISEWNVDKFEMDKETQILYSVDHDANNLYLALKVLDQRTQMKMMMQGMSLYLDKNGKKKEKTGIEFPIKKEREMGNFEPRSTGGRSGGGGTPGSSVPSQEAPDPKEMRERMASTMIFLKTFGFENQDEEKTQIIVDPSGISLAFNWDDANNMYIEYQVPISLLGSSASLNGKPLGIGWKIHGMEPMVTSSSTSLVGVPAGSGRGGSTGGGRSGGSGRSAADFGSSSDSRFKDQSVWTKYVLTF